jgi:hypothetical protein
MRYDCRDIRRLLESDEHIYFDSFEHHLAECRRCRKLVQLDPEVEGFLETSLSGSVSASLHEDVMKAVEEEGRYISVERRLEKSLPIAATAVPSAITVVLILKWDEIKALFSSIDLSFLGKAAQGVLSNVKLPALGIERAISYIGNEPLIFAASLAAAALIWALSFLELEKIPK